MGDLNLTPQEHEALEVIEHRDIEALIDQCVRQGSSIPLYDLRLDRRGEYVAMQNRVFSSALKAQVAAKSPKKRAETETAARKAGRNLEFAIQRTQERSNTEKAEHELFYVDDHILSPFHVTDQLSVPISYRWRADAQAPWSHGTITFTHVVRDTPLYEKAPTIRKPSARRREQDREDELHRTWDHLKRLGLHAVRECLRMHRTGAEIPTTFAARVDAYTRHLNNHSADFWKRA